MPFIEEMSNREKEWENFAEKVLHHVGTYAVPQYGDKPYDQISNWTPEDCIRDIKRRCERFGTNQREGHDRLDLLKIAHVAGVAWTKLKEEEEENKKKESFFKKLLRRKE